MKHIKKMEATKKTFYYWETYKNGMYKTYSEIENYDYLFNCAKNVLTNQSIFYEFGISLITNWHIVCNVFLNNSHINKTAFIGQASCCYAYKVPEIITKDVWKILDIETQNKANKTAIIIIKEYEARYRKLYSKMEEIWI